MLLALRGCGVCRTLFGRDQRYLSTQAEGAMEASNKVDLCVSQGIGMKETGEREDHNVIYYCHEGLLAGVPSCDSSLLNSSVECTTSVVLTMLGRCASESCANPQGIVVFKLLSTCDPSSRRFNRRRSEEFVLTWQISPNLANNVS